jgi:hypothetical protein
MDRVYLVLGALGRWHATSLSFPGHGVVRLSNRRYVQRRLLTKPATREARRRLQSTGVRILAGAGSFSRTSRFFFLLISSDGARTDSASHMAVCDRPTAIGRAEAGLALSGPRRLNDPPEAERRTSQQPEHRGIVDEEGDADFSQGVADSRSRVNACGPRITR